VTLLFALQAAGCVAVALIVVWTLFGPRPRRLRPVLALGAGFVGIVGLPIAVLLATSAGPRWGALAGGVAVLGLAVGAWAARGPGDLGADADGVDWAEFDRERERWERARRD
jgi:hypothetical protein